MFCRIQQIWNTKTSLHKFVFVFYTHKHTHTHIHTHTHTYTHTNTQTGNNDMHTPWSLQLVFHNLWHFTQTDITTGHKKHALWFVQVSGHQTLEAISPCQSCLGISWGMWSFHRLHVCVPTLTGPTSSAGLV